MALDLLLYSKKEKEMKKIIGHKKLKELSAKQDIQENNRLIRVAKIINDRNRLLKELNLTGIKYEKNN